MNNFEMPLNTELVLDLEFGSTSLCIHLRQSYWSKQICDKNAWTSVIPSNSSECIINAYARTMADRNAYLFAKSSRFSTQSMIQHAIEQENTKFVQQPVSQAHVRAFSSSHVFLRSTSAHSTTAISPFMKCNDASTNAWCVTLVQTTSRPSSFLA